jgi:hypothetical protein
VTNSGSRSTRRTKQEIATLKAALFDITKEIQPATVRGIFYQMEVRGFIEKSDDEYKRTVVRLLSIMRKAHELPYSWITDSTRYMRKPLTYSGLEQMLEEQSKLYRRALWTNQAVDVEVWLEKDALLGVLYPVTSKWDVPLMVTRGYSSLSFAWGAAEELSRKTWPTHIYNLGDHDPRGRNISESLERTLSLQLNVDNGVMQPF